MSKGETKTSPYLARGEPVSFEFDKVVTEMEGNKDLTHFGVVRQYFVGNLRGITMIGIVQEGFQLAEVAARLVDPEVTKDNVTALLESGALKFAVPNRQVSYEPPWRPEFVVEVSEINDSTYCFALFLPPLYLIKICPGKTWPH